MFNFGSPANPPKTGTATNPLTSTPASAGTLQFNLGQSAASGDSKPGSTMFPLASASSTPSLGFSANFNQPKQAVAPTLNFGAPAAASNSAGFGTGFSSPAPAASAAPALSFGFGSSAATPAASSAAPTMSFGLGAAPASTSAAPTVSFGLGAPTATSAAPTVSFGLGAPASTSAPSLSFGFGAPATSTSTPSLSFGFGASTGTTATSSATFTPILSSAATTAPTSEKIQYISLWLVLKFGPTPTATTDAAKPLPSGTTAAATTTTASSGFSIGGAATSAAGAPTTSAPAAAPAPAPAPAVGALTFAQLEDSINKWTIDLEEQGKFFINQAKQLNAWDGLLVSNGEKILSLNSSIEKVKQQQSQLDQELDFILAQQKELEELIIPLEKELVDVPIVDIDRNQMYQFSEIIDFQLKQISDDLKEIIESINESNKDEEVSNPVRTLKNGFVPRISQNSRALMALCRATGTSATSNAAAVADTPASSTALRPQRQEPGKVRFGFVPEEWFQAFYNKTGVTGPYAFAFTLSTYLVSKEIYVLEHEFYSGLSILIMWTYGIKKLGPKVAAFLDKDIDNYEKEWNSGRENEKEVLQSQIANEEKLQWSIEGQNLLLAAKRENVGLQLEANYRERLHTAYQAVKNRLEYQVEKTNAERRIAQKNLIEYVVARVKASITPDQEKQNINKCISDLALLAKA
ncbi:hypothetical protein YQE_06034, partial [Dendroctonus ponderosae]